MKRLKLIIAALAVGTALSAATNDEQALYDLVGRIAPQHQSNFVFKQKKQKAETYTIESKGG